MLYFLIVVVFLCFGLGAALATWEHFRGDPPPDRSGWVYFLSGPGTDIKIGSTQRDPTKDRMPEIRTMSPVPLRIIFKFRAPDVWAAEAAVHRELADSRTHGEWFQRDATLAFIDYLRGADAQPAPRSTFDDAVSQ